MLSLPRSVYRASLCILGVVYPGALAGATASDQLLYDARITYDIAHLPLDPVVRDGGAWVLIRVSPDSHSGSAVLPARPIDGAKSPSGSVGPAEAAVAEFGTWQRVAAIDKPGKITQGRYAWTEPRRFHRSQVDISELYSPFSRGGTVFCRYQSGAVPQARFQPAYLVPPAWQKSFRTAYAELKRSLEFTPVRARRLLGAPNPILSLLAFRILLDSSQLDQESLRAAVKDSEGYKRAAFIYLAALHRSPLGDGFLQSLVRGSGRPRTRDQQKWTALGVFTFAVLNPELDGARKLVATLLAGAGPQPGAPGLSANSDPYVREIAGLLARGQAHVH